MRTITRSFLVIFLVTLPITFLPFLSGVTAGVLFVFWKERSIDRHIDLFLREIDERLSFDRFSVPGTHSFAEFMESNTAFHIPILQTADWTRKLHLVLPNEYTDFEHDPDIGIDKVASLTDLVYDTRCGNVPPSHQWVFVTDLALPDYLPWDAAFDSFVQSSYLNSAENQTNLAFVTCAAAGFLCGVWNVKAPALIHFTVEDRVLTEDELDPDKTYPPEITELHPVSARVIEFPLKEEYTGLPANTFPSERQQLRSIVTGEHLLEQFEEYQPHEMFMRRFVDYHDELVKKKGTVLYYMGQAEDWMIEHITEPLGIEAYLEDLMGVAFLITVLLTEVIRWPIVTLWSLAKSFLGYPLPGDWITGDFSKYEGNIYDDMVDDFFDLMADKLKDPSTVRSALQHAMTDLPMTQ